MEQQAFFKYLRKGGRKQDVAERVIRLVTVFAEFLAGRGTNLDSPSPTDLDAFVTWVDEEKSNLPKHDDIVPSARSYLWAICYYYRFTENEDLARYAGLLREGRIKRKPFQLKDFRGMDPDQIKALKAHKITNINQMLKAGKTPQLRTELAEKTGIPVVSILELVRLSDLARLPGVKSIRARLYHDAGIVSIAQFASMQEEDILRITCEFVESSGFDGIPPLPAEVKHGITTARSLAIILEE